MHCSPPQLPTPSLVGLSVPVRNPLSLAMWMPDTEQKQDLAKHKQLQQRKRGTGPQPEPAPPAPRVSVGAKGISMRFFHCGCDESETGPQTMHIYSSACIYMCVCVRVYVLYSRMEAYTAVPRDSLPTEDRARATYWL